MKPDPFSPSDETHLHALADDRLPRAQAESLHSRMDSSQRQRAEAWAQQRAQLQTLHADWLRQPVPNVLVQAAERLQDAHDTQQHWARWGGFAAGWVLAFGLGWSL
ncbi:MAG: anti-sigma factor, partial [Diaphorobacter nitroreducens]